MNTPFDLHARRAHLLRLRHHALEMRDQAIPGVELWSRLTALAIQPYTTQPDRARSCDQVMQDLAIVILGPFALKYLRWFDQITPDLFQDPLVNQFFADFAALELPPAQDLSAVWSEAGYAGKLDDTRDPGLDQNGAADFRPELNDGTDNQIFHTFFYQFMAYVTRAAAVIRAASVYHELFDKGGSVQDHAAALVAIQTGTCWRQLRDSTDPQLVQWPELIRAAYGRFWHGEAALPLKLRQETDQLLHQPGRLAALLRQAEETLIRWKNTP